MDTPLLGFRNIASRRSPVWIAAALLACGFSATGTSEAQVNAQISDQEIVELNLAGSVSLPQLVEAMSKQLDVRFLYSADLANRQVTVYTPARLPKNVLRALLGSLLKGENLAIVDSDVPGWKRIVDIADIVPYAAAGEAGEVLQRDGPAAVVTQVVPVRNADITRITQLLRPFLSNGANFITLPENRLVIVTDYAQNVKKMFELLKLIDEPTGQAVIEFYETRNRTPASLIEQVEALLSKEGTAASATETKLFNDASGRRVVVAGEQDRVERIMLLLKQLDTGMDFQTRVYRLQNVSAERIDKLVRGLISSDEAETAMETTIDEDGNLLIVRASGEVHSQIETLIEEVDRPVDSSESPIQFYKLRNANAIEVLYSLLALQQAAGAGQFQQAGGLGSGAFGTLGGLNVGGVMPAFGISPLGGVVPMGGVPSTSLPLRDVDAASAGANGGSMQQNQNAALSPLIGSPTGGMGVPGQIGGGLGGGMQVATLPGGARVSADVATNSLIVFAPANVQPIYEKLIRSLDQRRPQVMIEAEIVAVDTSDNFSLGVEVSIGDRQGNSQLFKFTSFGLSQIDSSGMITPSPSIGFNGVLLDPDVADVIVKAISSHSRGRVLASPKILVNDNQTGVLESVATQPFSSANASNTVSTTSLGGEQEAGTIITVTPHINEDDHLQLEFEVEFSAFTGTQTALINDNGSVSGVLPATRQVDKVESVVTIPDGKTVVVGGLKRVDESNGFTGVPFVENIPLLRELTSLSASDESTTSFFLFIRPRILRDSRFRDLRYLSDIEIQDAQIPGDAPTSRPMLIPCLKPPTQTARHPSRMPHPSSMPQP